MIPPLMGFSDDTMNGLYSTNDTNKTAPKSPPTPSLCNCGKYH